MAEDIQRSLDAGFDQHLTKPIDFQVLEHYLATVPAAAANGSVPARPRPGVFD